MSTACQQAGYGRSGRCPAGAGNAAADHQAKCIVPERLLFVRRLLRADVIAIATGHSKSRDVVPFRVDVERRFLPKQCEMSARISLMVAQVGKVGRR
jgi:hypothetical protein